MTTQLSGQFQLFAATEGTALPPSTTEVASFSDPNVTDIASDFTAMIVWGDGNTSTGTISGANGSFTVDGGNDYQSEGFFNASVTIVRTADNSQLTLGGTIEVTGDDGLTGSSNLIISGNPNQPLSNVTVATFTNTNTLTPASDFTTEIDWGDGTTTPGTLTGTNGSFSVAGSHTYAVAGDYTVTTFMDDIIPDGATGFATTQADIGFGGNETLNAATATMAIPSGTAVADFGDSLGSPSGDYTAMIDWGDSTPPTTGTVTGSNGQYTVTSSSAHTYADFGDFTLTVTIVNAANNNASTSMGGTVVVASDEVISGSGDSISANPSQALNNVQVASFTDTDGAVTAGQLTATVDWGDGTISAGTVSGGGGNFTVDGSHTYTSGGNYTTTVTLADVLPGTASGTATSTATINFGGQMVLNAATEDTALPANTAVATFNDSNLAEMASAFSAVINWGDGTTSPGTVGGSNGSFTVSAGHTYLEPGIDAASVTLTHIADQVQSTVGGNVVVTDANSFTPQTLVTGINGGQMTAQATFTDTDTVTLASGLEASIDWGDGSVSTGTVTGLNGQFTVSGAHTYTAAVSTTLTVTLDDSPGTAAASNSIALQAVPVLTITSPSVSATPSETFAASALFSASDVEAVPLSYQVEDESTGPLQGFWVLNGEVLPNGQLATVAAAQLSQLTFVAGASSSTSVTDTVEVSALNSAGSTGFSTFTVTASKLAPGDVAPVISAASVQESPNLTLAVSSLFSASVPQGETVVSYEVEDTTADSGHWVFNGTVEPSNQLIDVTAAQLSELSFDTGYGSDTLKVRANDGTQWGSFTSFTVTPPPNAAPPAGTKDTLVMLRNADGAYEFYDIGQNKILLDGPLGQINPALQVAGVGGFNGADTADLLMRDPATGAFTLYDVSSNNITGNVPLGQVGPEWTVSGVGDFSTRFGETDMLMRNSNNGAFEVYDISNNTISSAQPMGQVGLEWTVAGFGDFSTRANETDMLMRNANTGAFEVYDIANNTITSAQPMGQVGLEWQIAGFGDFSTRPGETDMLLRNSNNGAFEVYDIVNNAITSAQSMGQVGLEWTIAGFGDFSGNANETDMLMRNSNTGVFTLFDIGNNTVTGTAPMGQVGLEWSISGVSASVAGAPPNCATAQLTQAMASFAPTGATSAGSPLNQPMEPAPISTTLLTTNHA